MHSVDKAFQIIAIWNNSKLFILLCIVECNHEKKMWLSKKKSEKNNTCMYVIYHGCRTCRVYFYYKCNNLCFDKTEMNNVHVCK